MDAFELLVAKPILVAWTIIILCVCSGLCAKKFGENDAGRKYVDYDWDNPGYWDEDGFWHNYDWEDDAHNTF